MAAGDSAAQQIRRRAPAALLGLLAIAAYGTIATYTLFNGQTYAGEVSALVRSWWYATGAIRPYSAIDATRDMPLYLTALGFWQALGGMGFVTARALSVILGAISGVLLFLTCRRLTANTAAAAAAALIFLATPSTTFFFATATSVAAVATLHVAAIFLIVSSMGKPRVANSIAMGVVCAAIYFTRQDMVFGVIVLVPLYIAALGRDRLRHAALLLAVIAAATAAILAVFPAKLLSFALRLPLLSETLGNAGLLGPNYIIIDRGTYGPEGIDALLTTASLMGLLDSFVLPNAGTLLLTLALFAAAGGPLRVLWIAPLYFIWLAATFYLSGSSACGDCMLTITPMFAAVGALSAALCLAMSGRWAKANGFAPGALIVIGAVAAVAINTTAPLLASHPIAKSFPRPMLDGLMAPAELEEVPTLTRWITEHLPAREPVLVIEGLGVSRVAALPYAAAATGHPIPPQSLDLRATQRTINRSLVGDARDAVRSALEEQSLWSVDTMQRWIGRDYDAILFQDDRSQVTAALQAAIETQFDRTAATRYRGHGIILFTRRPSQ